MDSFLYDDKEIQCFCFNTVVKKSTTGLKPAPVPNQHLDPPKYRRIIKSVEEKFNELEGSRNKKSLKRQKPKTPTREIAKSSEREDDRKANLLEPLRQTQRPKVHAKLQWVENTSNQLRLVDDLPAKPQPEPKTEKRLKLRNQHPKILIQPVKFDHQTPLFPENNAKNSYPEINSPKIIFTASNPPSINTNPDPKPDEILQLKLKQENPIQGKKSDRVKRIYPKEIESVFDQNQLDEDEVSEIEWGWNKFQVKQRTGDNPHMETMNTMSSNIKNSSIKNSLFGVIESQLSKF